mmetsp:Transcript_16910/g.31666  ORF Transcript_16910/g.31666 Transcript_16910/m.31666 type:complete len:456 (-) Transcript_16910:630-1997(-)|eukprot:CAMPEP_0182500316 /NCGR_PEP_ID=MMETSP1321-20130603/8811_1 /TAXON_ID=91990 /ORGANISM="Bolidomonas sp., Strain RCC1657" /LENGTH=455 /DNA_ID=CAMNT_0024704703 /DNA_START=505 /DNA_END=1872 /DNA_ORIENTATION=+
MVLDPSRTVESWLAHLLGAHSRILLVSAVPNFKINGPGHRVVARRHLRCVVAPLGAVHAGAATCILRLARRPLGAKVTWVALSFAGARRVASSRTVVPLDALVSLSASAPVSRRTDGLEGPDVFRGVLVSEVTFCDSCGRRAVGGAIQVRAPARKLPLVLIALLAIISGLAQSRAAAVGLPDLLAVHSLGALISDPFHAVEAPLALLLHASSPVAPGHDIRVGHLLPDLNGMALSFSDVEVQVVKGFPSADSVTKTARPVRRGLAPASEFNPSCQIRASQAERLVISSHVLVLAGRAQVAGRDRDLGGCHTSLHHGADSIVDDISEVPEPSGAAGSVEVVHSVVPLPDQDRGGAALWTVPVAASAHLLVRACRSGRAIKPLAAYSAARLVTQTLFIAVPARRASVLDPFLRIIPLLDDNLPHPRRQAPTDTLVPQRDLCRFISSNCTEHSRVATG